MFFDCKRRSSRLTSEVLLFTLALLLMASGPGARAQAPDITTKLSGFDSYMEQVLKDWNTPGIGVGIVVNDKLVFAKGYGYRDYEKKLPFTPATQCQIASNSKLFTAVAAGMLVEEGKLTWDKPVRESVRQSSFTTTSSTTTSLCVTCCHTAPGSRGMIRSGSSSLYEEGVVRKAKVPRAAGAYAAKPSSTTTSCTLPPVTSSN